MIPEQHGLSTNKSAGGTGSGCAVIRDRLWIDLGPYPATRFIQAIDPAVLRVAIDLEKVNFVRIDHKQAEMRRRAFRVGMHGRKRDIAVTRPARLWPRETHAHRLAQLAPSALPGITKRGVIRLVPHERNPPTDSKLLMRNWKIPADLTPRTMFELGDLFASRVGDEGQARTVIQEPAEDDGAVRRPDVAAYGCHVDEPRVRRVAVLMHGQDK